MSDQVAMKMFTNKTLATCLLLLLTFTCYYVEARLNPFTSSCSNFAEKTSHHHGHMKQRNEKYGCGKSKFNQTEARQVRSAFPCEQVTTNGRKLDTQILHRSLGGSGNRFFSDGYHAKPGEFPSYAQLTFSHTTDHLERKQCGGTVLGDRLVITAAQCHNESRFNAIEISVGVVDEMDLSHEQIVSASRVCFMPGYKYSEDEAFRNDVLLIETNKSIIFNDYVAPACMSTIRDTSPAAKCYSVGRGMTANEGANSGRLIVLPMSKGCSAKPSYVDLIGRTCWQASGGDFRGNPCANDYGAPMYCFDLCNGQNARQYVVGSVSFGYEDSCIRGNSYYYIYSDFYKLRVELRDMLKRCFKRLKAGQ